MTITAQDIFKVMSHRAWSGFDNDEIDFNDEESLQAITELNTAVRYLVNLEDFIYKAREHKFRIQSNKNAYPVPQGQIQTVYNNENKEILTYIGSPLKYNLETKGKPHSFWIETNGNVQNIKFYPVPDNDYDLRAIYTQYKPVIDNQGFLKDEFTALDDVLNIPENLETLFMDCIVLRAMITNNKDDQDENYAPMKQEFIETWELFKKKASPANVQKRVVW